MKKVYVDVFSLYTKEGDVIPLKIKWKDSATYDIDKVLDVRKAASLKAGGCGLRYKCRIQGRERYLWFEVNENKWFVESTE